MEHKKLLQFEFQVCLSSHLTVIVLHGEAQVSEAASQVIYCVLLRQFYVTIPTHLSCHNMVHKINP